MQTLEAMALFLQSRKATGLSPHTIRWYAGILKRFAHRFPELPDSPTDIELFLLECQAQDERRHGYYRAVRAFYCFLHRRLHFENPIESIDPPKRAHKEPRWLMPSELKQVLNYPHRPKIRTALLFLIDTGARLGELARLTVEEIKETPWGFVAAVRGKAGTRVLPISYATYHALMVHLPLGYSTHRLGRLVSLAIKDAGLRGTAHSLRHTFGTLWEGDELVLQQIMGHTHLSTTKLYRHLRTQIISRQHHQYSPLSMIQASSQDMFVL